MSLSVKNLSLTHVIHLNEDVRNKHNLLNRIKKFKRQLNYHYNEKNYYPLKAEFEVDRLSKMLKYYLLNYLIINNSKITTIKKELNQWPTLRKHWENSTGLEYIVKKPSISPLKRQFLDNLEKKSMNARRSQHIWRIINELDIALFKNHYVIFNTLTVSAEHYGEVFSLNSKCFLNYRKKWDAIYGSDSHTYFCVLELGGETARHHYHVLHILKHLPVTWQTDINKAMYQPSYRVITAAQNMWEYGYSMPIAVRFSGFDAYAKLGWRWPYDLALKAPIKTSNPTQMAFYLAKYITKSLISKESKSWKTKLKNNFGLSILNLAIQQLQTHQLQELLIIAPMMVLRLHQTIIPAYFLTKMATKYLLLLHQNSSNSTKLMTLKARTDIITQFTSLTRPIPKFNLPKCGSTKIKNSTKTAISSIQNLINYHAYKQTGYDLYQPIIATQGETITIA